jgi:hypothetical protein
MAEDWEEQERQRLQRERKQLSPTDRLHGAPPRTTVHGFVDQRSELRTGRVVQIGLRAHPRIKAMMDAIKKRDSIPSMVVLLELMLEAYQKVYGALDESELPSLEDLVEQIEKERDKRDA